MPDPIDYLSLSKVHPPTPPVRQGRLSIAWDATLEKLVLVDEAGTAIPLAKETSVSILAALQGAEADPLRIGAEFMPQEFPVISLGLGDTGENALNAGRLGLNGDGQLVLHDADRNGDEIAPFATDNIGQLFAKSLNGASLSNIISFSSLARFRFPASVATSGRILTLSGSLIINNGFSPQPYLGIYFGIRRPGETNLDNMSMALLVAASGTHQYNFQLLFSLGADSLLGVALPGAMATLISPHATVPGNVTPVSAWYDATDFFPSSVAEAIATVGQPIDIEVFFLSMDTGGASNLGGSSVICGEVSMGHSA